MEPKDLALEIARIIEDRMGHDIVILDLQERSDITDYFVIATGDNNRMVDSIVDEIENRLRPSGIYAFSIEGRQDNTWDLMDFGAVIVHIFQPETRDFYRLEHLWGDAPRAELVDGELVSEKGSGTDRQDASSENADRDAFNAAVRAIREAHEGQDEN